MADKKISALTAATTPLAGTEVLPIVQSGATVKVAVSDLTAGRAMAALSLTTATVQASNSGGLALKNSGGTTQMLLGGGGGDNITLSVATNITPANAAVAISPTGTGTVTLNPATASTINNMSIGATTALAGRFTDVTLTTGNLIVASGQGIDFSATPGTGTSELLADYEQGTWTPVIEGTSSAGTGTYSVQNGNYTKIGNLVTCICYVAWSAHTGTGNQLIVGLPFTSIATALYGPVYANINTPLAASNINTNYIGPTNAKITMLTHNTITGADAAYALQTSGGYALSFLYYTN